MTNLAISAKHAEEAASANRTIFGFWLYLMTDCVLFASLFATYAVLRIGTNGGPTGADIFDLPFVLVETFILLTSSFVCGLMMLAAHAGKKKRVLQLLAVTATLGAVFVGMELYEFHHLYSEGYSWQLSGFLSAYFTLVATHGLHISVGLLWAIVLGLQIMKRGLKGNAMKRLTMFSIFWHFLDVVWIFIFSIVYLWSGRL